MPNENQLETKPNEKEVVAEVTVTTEEVKTEVPEDKPDPNVKTSQLVNYMKSFSTFEEGFKEACEIFPIIKEYCGSFTTLDAVKSSLLDKVKSNLPKEQDYPNSISLSIDAYEFSVRMIEHMAFGCRIKISRKDGQTYYSFRITCLPPLDRENEMKQLEEKNWKKVVSVMQSNFWDKVEGKEKRTRRDPKYKGRYFKDTGERTPYPPRPKYHKPFHKKPYHRDGEDVKKDGEQTKERYSKPRVYDKKDKPSFNKPNKPYKKPYDKRNNSRPKKEFNKPNSNKPKDSNIVYRDKSSKKVFNGIELDKRFGL